MDNNLFNRICKNEFINKSYIVLLQNINYFGNFNTN